MKRQAAELLHERLDSITCGAAELRDDYSGRGMYGDTTYGISGDFGYADVVECVAELFEDGSAQDEGLKPTDFRFSSDSMGLGIIIY
jgi:hypothetical protein